MATGVEMIHISDKNVASLLQDNRQVQQALKDAFINLSLKQAAQQMRMRTEAQTVKLSTLAAVLPTQGVAGAKIYSTINGQFNFVIVLFSTETGLPLATLDAGMITKKRTAASSILVAQCYADPQSKKLALFGLGVQGYEHAVQFAQAFPLERIYVVSPAINTEKLQSLTLETGVEVVASTPEEAVKEADIIVTASRSKDPVVKGEWLKLGAFIAAIGSSLPTTRELDDEVIQRVSQIVIESKEQTLSEAGDLLIPKNIDLQGKLICIEDIFTQPMAYDRSKCVLYKAVGVALQDVAIAGLVYKNYLDVNQ